MSSRLAVLSGFKKLLKTTDVVFHGDSKAITYAKQEIRAAFRSNLQEKDAAKIASFIREIHLADEFARENLVQAELKSDGRFHAKIEERHVVGSSKGGLEEELEGGGCCKVKKD